MALIYPGFMPQHAHNTLERMVQLAPYCPGFHIDCMDGLFVSNQAGSYQVVNTLLAQSKKQLWLHLMVQKPKDFIEKLIIPAGTLITFHYEAKDPKDGLIEFIVSRDCLPGIALNPASSFELAIPYLPILDHILVMGVQPGFSGQMYIPEMVEKVKKAAAYKQLHNLNFKIGFDGGVTTGNIQALASFGVELFAASSAIFKAHDPTKALQELQALI